MTTWYDIRCCPIISVFILYFHPKFNFCILYIYNYGIQYACTRTPKKDCVGNKRFDELILHVGLLTDLLVVEAESFPRGVSITDESHSQYIPG